MLNCFTSLDDIKSHSSASIDDIYKKYLVVFYHFVSNELCISLRMPTDYNSDISSGRNIATIVAFYEAFRYIQTKTTIGQLADFDQRITRLVVSLEEYINTANDKSCKIDFEDKYDFEKVEKSYFDLLSDKFEDFFDSDQMHDDFEDAKHRYLYNAKPKSLGCIQALIEFFNAISHILACFASSADEEIFQSNLEKAKAHISRGTLDNYKSIIKNGFEILGNNLLSCTQMLGETKPLSLVEIRKMEFSLLGHQLSSEQKAEMLLGYKNACQNIIDKFQTSEPVKRVNSLTLLQQNVIYEVITKANPFDAYALGQFIRQVKDWDVSQEQKFAHVLPLWVYMYILVYLESKEVVNLSVGLLLPKVRQDRYQNFKDLHTKMQEKGADKRLAALMSSMRDTDNNLLLNKKNLLKRLLEAFR